MLAVGVAAIAVMVLYFAIATFGLNPADRAFPTVNSPEPELAKLATDR